MNKNFYILLFVIITAFTLRFANLTFPSFTSDEARIAYRGYVIATSGKDELGRAFPLLFNSLEDYQLPAVSYLTAAGQLLFGKSEFGARIPFIIIGTLLVLIVYKLSKFFSPRPYIWFISALMTAFSPSLIFLSKIPNETILLTFIFALLFYLFLNNSNKIFIILTMITAVFTSKQAWFILFPFVVYILLFYQKSWVKKDKLILIAFTAVLVLLAFTFFFSIPQARRSLSENNFSIFSNITIKNGIDKLRGQGLLSGWPPVIDRYLFNKLHFLTTGFLHWLSNISTAIYFGQMDSSGKINYSSLGAWAKIIIIPFVVGFVSIINKGDQKKKLLVIFFLLLTYPAIFVYPNLSTDLVVLTLPFMALIIALGFERLNKQITVLIFFLMILEIAWNISFVSAEYKNTADSRPILEKDMMTNITEKPITSKIAVSDDLVSDIVPYIEWYTLIDPNAGFEQVNSPYKFRQYSLGNIKVIGSDEKFSTCGIEQQMKIFVSNRDLKKIQTQFNIIILKIYNNNSDVNKVFLIEGVCT
ncbi:glycosyltransferase family 39 protein [Candidatus Daviesbacteria bacterium]|nr:glycosyltransferase family 39 protein [Candidatus Daviesbacteria bacterium]